MLFQSYSATMVNDDQQSNDVELFPSECEPITSIRMQYVIGGMELEKVATKD